jgi:tetratricopeptide (TPR) repeat protein
MSSVFRTASASFLLLALAVAPLSGQEHHHHPAGDQELLGTVVFPVSCLPEVQDDFNRAVAMLHSFWFQEADAAFQALATRDPGCAMAHWGRAMTMWGNIMTRISPAAARVPQALAEVERARALAAGATPRERGYIEAVAALWEEAESVGHLERMQRHEAAMDQLRAAHPEDAEATIFYGRVVVANAHPEDLTFARQLHAAQVMEPLFFERPDHPGLAHYIIHAYDAPPIADRGLDAARRYAAIAPAAPHALHMPSHIFTRLGYWQESIEMNTRSAQAEPVPDAAVHPLDYLVYAHLQLGQDGKAAEVVGRARAATEEYAGGQYTYNLAAMPARYALERGDWAAAARLPVPEGSAGFVEAVSRFARAVGAARAGDADAARQEVQSLAGLREALRAAGDDYWATAVEAQRLAAAAWTAHAAGDTEEALRLAAQGAELEDTFEKHPVTPGPLLPARELQGDLLLEVGRYAEARAAYEATLKKEPRRARALLGAARAAERAGDAAAAAERYRELLELMAEADAERPEPALARSFLEGR